METAGLEENPQMVFTLSSGGFPDVSMERHIAKSVTETQVSFAKNCDGNATPHIYGQFRVAYSPRMHAFGLREEAGGPGEKPHRRRTGEHYSSHILTNQKKNTIKIPQ